MSNKVWNALTQVMFEIRLMLQTCQIILIILKLTNDFNMSWWVTLIPLWLWLLITGSLTLTYFVLYLKDKKIQNKEE